MKQKYLLFHLSSLAVLFAASVYPIYMGIKTFTLYLSSGAIDVANYPKYIIPYAPMCAAILFVALHFPALYRLFKKFSLVAASGIGLIIFFALEVFFEQIKVIEGYKTLPLSSWQYSICCATPEVLKSIGEPIYAENNPSYKVHFYLIAAVIIIAVTGLIYGFTHMIKENDRSKKKPLIAQLVCVAVFVGLCVLACFTAFYRNGTLNISPLSAFLMSLFFIMFGVTTGVYAGTLLFGKSIIFRSVLPAFISLATTVVMYIGELVLMGGKLFRFGEGVFYEPVGSVPFAPCDILIILLSGSATFLILEALKSKKRSAYS